MKRYYKIFLFFIIVISVCVTMRELSKSTYTVDTLPIISLANSADDQNSYVELSERWTPPELYNYVSFSETLDFASSTELFPYPNECYSQDFIYLADLNSDGTYEVYINLVAGSGMIHQFVKCYEPVSKEYYVLENRFLNDYICICYQNSLYIKDRGGISKPLLTDDELVLEPVSDSLQDEISNWLDAAFL